MTGNIVNSGIAGYVQLAGRSTLTGNIINSGTLGGIQLQAGPPGASAISGHLQRSTGVISETARCLPFFSPEIFRASSTMAA